MNVTSKCLGDVISACVLFSILGGFGVAVATDSGIASVVGTAIGAGLGALIGAE